MNHLLDKKSWYFIAPTISSLHCFVQSLPINHKGVVKAISSLTGEASFTRTLFTSRLKRVVFSISSQATVDVSTEMHMKESQFLFHFCRRHIVDSWCRMGGKSILLMHGSNAIVHRDEHGEVLAVIISPITGNGEQICSPRILSAITDSNFDVHTLDSNCKLLLS